MSQQNKAYQAKGDDLKETLVYLKNFLKDRHVASVTPSSGFSIRRLLSKIDFARVGVIVEYGPGSGVITRHILKRLRPDARLFAFETNAGFVKLLRARIRDPRFTVFHRSAAKAHVVLAQAGIPFADCVLSGIPFSLFNSGLRRDILSGTSRLLKSDGKFLIYQAFPQMPMAGGTLVDCLRVHWEQIAREYEILNIPPLCIYEVSK